MDRWLKENLDGIPYFIEKKYDVVGVISGTSKVRLGKSTIAMQVGYYIAWILAGGRTILSESGTMVEVIPPKREVKFGLDNIVFAPEDLKKKAHELPPNSMIVYDEGRAGLDASRSMESVNKGMQDFFQECGVYGHVILIVLPDFFQLHQSYAVSRSLFLINVFTDEQFKRGYFSFYNERQKELLYFWGKKKVGAYLRYASAKRNFWGRFSDWLPFNKDEYENMKKQALERKRVGYREIQQLKERDLLIHFIIMHCEFKKTELVEALDKFGYNDDAIHFTDFKVQKALRNVARLWSGAEFVPDNYQEIDAVKELDEQILKDLKMLKDKRDKAKKPMPVYNLSKEEWNEKIFDKDKSKLSKTIEHLAAEFDVKVKDVNDVTYAGFPNKHKNKKNNDSDIPIDVPLVRGEGIMPEEMGIEIMDEEKKQDVPELGEKFELPKQIEEDMIESSYR
ncbi:hypothetical protein M0R04_08730 [Candidatus Dojkabacteria bacterium]|jgi:hypothetical protein|nr:hypothetical protein [Candidatus Dojkabacteria bacterium]